MNVCMILIILNELYTVLSQLIHTTETDVEYYRTDIIVDIIKLSLKGNGWSTISTFGDLPDEFYFKLQNSSRTFTIINLDHEDEDMENIVPYYSNIVIVNLLDINDYMDTITILTGSPYWHPHSNLILYYHQNDQAFISKIFFSLWYNKVINAIIVQYDDDNEKLLISYYTPYTSDSYKLDHLHGCWTSRKLGMPITSLEDAFICENGCHNVSLYSKLRPNNLGTCIGFSTIEVPYNNPGIINTLSLFEDKTEDFHGFTFRAYTTEIEPFFYIYDHHNGTYTLDARDGNIWNTMSKLMNFNIDLTPSVPTMKEPFSYELNIKQLFDIAFRRADIFLVPIYLFDLVVLEIDYTFPYRDSGVCIMSVKAGFETALFDVKKLHANRTIILQFIICFLCTWFIFTLYQIVEKGSISLDQIGKDFLNAIRNILLISLFNPPKKQSFRIFLTVSIWTFFIFNFATQATFVSLLTAAKRGKDVNTFEDVIDKGYYIYGMASPDIILPDTEEKFNIINSRLIPVENPYECIVNFTFDSPRFCLVDCSVGRYFTKNKLNRKGEQFLYIAKDKMHSHYLTMILSKHSPIKERFDKFLMRFLEAGLINKWEKYRYTDIKEEAPIKPLGMNDLRSLFDLFGIILAFIVVIFFCEIIIYNILII